MKLSEATRLIQRLASMHPRVSIPPETIAGYAEALEDLALDVATAAVNEAIATLKFFPSVAELRDIAARRRSSMPTAADAWSEVTRAFGAVGRYRTPRFSHPAIERVVDAMGWVTLCDSDNVEATRAHFLRMYAETADRVVREVNVQPMLDAASERKRLERTGETRTLMSLLPGGKAGA